MHVKVGYWYASEDEFVGEEESQQMVIQHFEVNGHWISSEIAMMRNYGPFFCLFLPREVPEDESSPFILRSYAEVLELADEIGADDWLDEISLEGHVEVVTDETTLCIPISSIEWVDMKTVA